MASHGEFELEIGGMLARGFDWDSVRYAPRLVGEFAELKYGKSLVESARGVGAVPVYGTNGQCGWHDKPLVPRAGMILGRKGQGHLGVHWCDVPFWVIDTAYYAAVEADVNLKWFYYITKYVGLDHLKTGEKPGLNRDTFSRQYFPFPVLEEQRAIARVLGSLDDKIDLNQRMNRTLEAMAQALFQSWFVNFDPVHAKAAGRETFGMSSETAALFPDRLTETETGIIPEGWRFLQMREMTKKIGSGATPRGGSRVYVEEGVALIRSQNVYDHEFRWEGLARINDEAADELRGVKILRDDVLINITGDSILRTCVVEPSVLPARVNQHVSIIRARDDIPPRYIHLYLVMQETKDFLLGFDSGGSRKAITKGHLESLPVLHPGRDILAEFARATDPLFRKVVANQENTRTLANARDLLLPRLLSGEIRVGQADRLMEAAL